MRSTVAVAGVLAVAGTLSSPLIAQWPSYPTSGVPRSADGKPNLTAPAPRTADGKPDLSGIVIIYEANAGIRQIFMDGRPAPNNDPQPWWFGYSRGWWEGDTLVVETMGFRDDGWLDVNGAPLTSEGKLTERFRRPNFGTLEIDVTIDDPKAYTRPWTVRVNQRLLVDTELIEFVCLENEKFSRGFRK